MEQPQNCQRCQRQLQAAELELRRIVCFECTNMEALGHLVYACGIFIPMVLLIIPSIQLYEFLQQQYPKWAKPLSYLAYFLTNWFYLELYKRYARKILPWQPINHKQKQEQPQENSQKSIEKTEE